MDYNQVFAFTLGKRQRVIIYILDLAKKKNENPSATMENFKSILNQLFF